MEILSWNPFKKGINKAAYQGTMHCPFCSKHADPTTSPIGFETEKSKIVFLGNVGPLVREYGCKSCGGKWRYDLSARPGNPYETFRGLKMPSGVPAGMKFVKKYI